ncbi:helix-turn-helix transcriptional regulator [Priestia megaterium]|uniref:helix-turn-helix transcriptional regulator n=1 Tax=Priestia megaterium TaxID=1404 RepID=UPI002E1BF2E2|nr:helix-turn-helix transcriptional regulator [Priestia megaterium]
MELAKLKDTAELFKRVRSENDLSKTALAKRINSSVPYVSSIESKKKIPGENLLTRLASEFSIDLEQCLALREPSKLSIGKEEAKSGRKKKSVKETSEKVIELHKEKGEVVLSEIKSAAMLFRTVRKANNLTLSMMKSQMDSPASYLSSIETGNKIPGKRLVTKLAERFNLPLVQCLKIAGFTEEEESKVEKQAQQEQMIEDKTSKKSESIISSDLSSIEYVEAEYSNVEAENTAIEEVKMKTQEKELAKNEISKKVNKKEEVVQLKEKPLVKKVKRNTEAVKTAKLDYCAVAKGEFDLSDGKSFVADLNLLMDKMEDGKNSYEFTFVVDAETNQTVQLKMSQGIVTVESNKQKHWIVQ